MTAQGKRTLSYAEYVAQEAASREVRHEFLRGDVERSSLGITVPVTAVYDDPNKPAS